MTGTLAPAPTAYAMPVAACDRMTVSVQDGTRRISALLRIRDDAPYLPDHFPEITIFPGVFILEAVLQATAQAFGERAGRHLRPCAVLSLRFLVPLVPGDDLHVVAEATQVPAPRDEASHRVLVSADCRRGDGVRVATVRVECGWSP